MADAGVLAVDAAGTRPGRGTYLCPDGRCAQAARRRRAFSRRLRAEVEVPDDLETRLADAGRRHG